MSTNTIRKISLPQLIAPTSPFESAEILEPFVWTSSALKTFRRCKRLFYWKYLLRLNRRIRNKNLFIGGLFHEILGQWYRSKHSSMAKVAEKIITPGVNQLEAEAALYDQDDYDDIMTDVHMLTGMLVGYSRVYGVDRLEWDIERKGIEQEFEVNMGDFIYRGKIDLCARRRSKHKVKKASLFEHKTASRIDESYIDRLSLDTQVRGYVFGAIHGLGIPVDEVIYDVVKKCKLRRKGDETLKQYYERIAEDYEMRPGFYFYREALKFDKSDIDAFEYEVRQTHREFRLLVADMANPLDPREWGINDAACREFFRLCEFHSCCTECVDARTGLLFEQRDSLHQELTDISD